ncbi:MAG TPA: hypothetical protein VNY05_43020 [Candidatus Acidoferrales bacterium]|nr:hypothetical protein [Candidatus Acidoferrales bacterium]
MRVFAVWEPMLATDIGAPTSLVLQRLKDSRARQFWDPRHTLAKRLAADVHPPQPKQHCCEQEAVLWDLAAVYPPGAVWAGQIPAAAFFDGPVVKVQVGLEAALVGR